MIARESDGRPAGGSNSRVSLLSVAYLLSAGALLGQRVSTVSCPADPRAAGTPIIGVDTATARCLAARAQQTADLAQDQSFSIPESPAFTFLNSSPAEITRPSSPREFAAALLSGVDPQGRVQQGFALEFSPFPVVPGFTVPLREYQRSLLKRAAYRTQVSIGTVRASGDSASTDVAIGIRSTLVDDADPMQSSRYTDSLAARMMTCVPDEPFADTTVALRCIEGAIDATTPQWISRWNGRRVVVAFAVGRRFVNSDPNEGAALGWRAWALAANPLGNWGIILGYLEVGRRNGVAGSPTFSSLRYGGRTVVGASTLNGFLEVIGESRFNASASATEGGASWSAGMEIKATDGVWLSTGFGQRHAETRDPDRIMVIANLRLGLSRAARFSDLQRNEFEWEQ